MLRGFRKLLSPNSVVPGARHALPRRTIARASAVSVALSSLLLVPLAPANAAACAPTSSTVGADTVLSFTTVETCDWTVPVGVSSVRVLLVGGGGGGGGDEGGGGGAGQFRDLSSQSVSGTVTVTVGAGGPGADYFQNDVAFDLLRGDSSAFGDLVAFGGGTGGSGVNDSNQVAKNGQGGDGYGSGGGGSGNETTYGSGDGGAAGTGNAGGTPGTSKRGGGGGGAGAAGSSTGAGGDGSPSDITGVSVTYAGGGGGGSGNSASGSASGGTGGAGSGGGSGTAPTSASANSGSGGGGGGGVAGNGITQYYGGNGGSGIVVVRYTTPVVPTTVQNFTASTRLVDADTDADSVTLNWDALTGQTPAVTSYEIEYSTASNYAASSTQSVAVTNASAATPNTATISGLTDGATYYFRIKARNAVGVSASYAETSSVAVSNADYAVELTSSGQFADSGTGVAVVPASDSSYTIEAWVKPAAVTSETYYVIASQNQLGTGTDANKIFLSLKKDGSSYDLYFSSHTDVAATISLSDSSIPIGDWSHIALVANSTKFQVYVNGVMVSEVSATVTSVNADNAPFSIGSSGGTDPRYQFSGSIDQVKVWNTARSQDQIASSMHVWGATSGDESALLSHYDFNDNTQSTTLRDQAGSNDLNYTSVATSDLKPLVEKDTSAAGYGQYTFTRSYLTGVGGWVAPESLSGAQVVIVGAGGGGGENVGGGGAGGGTYVSSSVSISQNQVSSIVVGQGGRGGSYPADSTTATTLRDGAAGQESFTNLTGSTLTASGGAGGETYWSNNICAGSGRVVTTSLGGAGGGTGGAGGNGGASGTSAGSAGASGQTVVIAGFSNNFGAGGGAGGWFGYNGGAAGGSSAGAGGGVSTASAGGEGLANHGGGGGGGYTSCGAGGDGGSGVVVLAYATGSVSATSPSSVTVSRTRTATFTTTATAAGTVSYQWQLSSDSGSNWANIAGATSASYTTGTLAFSDSGNQYRAVVTSSLNGGTATTTTSAATVTVTNTSACAPTEDKSSSPGYTILKFTNAESCVWTNDTGKTTFDVAVVGGGGGGGFGNLGGGGGAGEVIVSSSSLTIDANAERFISIGAGGTSGAPSGDENGAGGSGTWTFGGDGSASTFDSFSAYGGGGGGGGTSPNNRSAGAQGGSGGGSDQSNAGVGAARSHSHTGWTSYANAGGGGAGKGGGGGGAGTAGNVLQGGGASQGRGGYFVEVWGVKLAGGGGAWPGGLGAEGTSAATVLGGNARNNTTGYPYVGNSQGVANTGTGGGAGAPGGSGVVMIRYASPLSITTPTTGLSATVDTAYSLSIATDDGAGTNVFSVTSGSLPAGLSLNSSTGVISGTPTTAGDQAIQVTVTDSAAATATTSSFTITVGAATLSAVGTPTVTATSGTLKSIDVSWVSVANANSYSLKIYATDGTTLLDTISLANSLTSYTITSSGFGTIADGVQYRVSLTAVGSGNYVSSSESAKVAVTTLASYAITYNSNSATGGTVPASQTKTHDTDLTLAANSGSLVRTGYTFAGWNTGADGLGTTYAAGATYSVEAADELFAKWTANNNTVTFKSNFVGGASDTTQSITTDQETALTANGLTRAGYTFAGWNTNADGSSGTDYTDEEAVTITGALTLYAKWTELSVPTAPIAVSSTASSSSIIVGWSAPAELASKTITGYKVEYANADRATWATAGEEPWVVASNAITAGSTSYTITGLTLGESYYVRVAALYSGGQGAYGYRWTSSPVYETTQPFRDGDGEIIYSSGKGVDSNGNAETSIADFSRIRYRMEATYGGADNYVDANFDRDLGTTSSGSSTFSSIDKLQVPTISGTGRQFKIQGNVSDMNVQSNVTSVIDGAGLNGRLEIWPHDYQTTSALGDGSDDYYDISDTSLGTGRYGSFQVHRLDGVNEPVLSWNRHFESDINNVDIGFGSQPTSHPDWTFAARDNGASDRTNFKLQIFVNEPVQIPSSYAVTWNSNGGSSVSSSVVSAAAQLAAPTPPTRSGYNFAGWSATDGGAAVSFPYTHGKTADFTMFAVWERASYTVTYNYNYGSETNTTATHASGEKVTLPTPERAGFTFKGWYTASSGGTKVGDAGDEVTTLATTDLILRYELDDPSSYSGTGTTIADVSGLGTSNATATNGPVFSTADGMSFAMDGSNDYILTSDLLSRAGASNTNISIFAWVKPTGNGVVVSEIGQATIDTSWHDSQIEVVDGKFKFRTWSPDGFSTEAVTSDSITLNQWYYVGLVYDGTKLTGYVDGVSVGSTANYTRSAPTTGLYYALGATDSTNLGDGTYGDFRLGSFHVYKSGLTAATVLDNYQATCARFVDGCTEQTLFAQWDVSGYVVTYAAGDNGTGASQTATKTDGVNLTLPDSATVNGYFTRTGYTVTSWSTNSDGTTSDYALGGTYSADAIETLYPVWTADTYTITFNKGDDGTGSDETATKTHDVDFTIPNSATSKGYFTRTGYTISSWSTNSDGSTSDFAFGATYSTEAAETLYPVWTANTYTVTYNYNGATGGNGAATSSYTVDGIVVSLPTPTKPGFTFAGWYSDSGLTSSIGVAGASYSPSANVTAYAKWSAATFTVIYAYNDADGGNSSASNTFTTGSTVITLPTPTRTGYTFGGWYSNSNLTDISTVGAGGADYSPTTNLTIYAKWTAVTRSVTYNTTNAGSGTAPTDATSYTIGQNVVLKSNSGSLARTGYTFAGWVTNSDGSGTAKNAGETLSVETADINFYPQWSANNYTVSYSRNGATGGALAKATDTYTTGQSPGLTLPGGGTMTKTGYSFAGWSASTTGTIPLGTYTTTTNVTLYAIWTPVDYTFSYDLNTGSGAAPSDQAANVEETVTVSGIGAANKTGHWFAGWNSASDGSGTSYAVGSSTAIPVGGLTVYAIWVPDAYKISYNANGGTGGPDLSATAGFDTATFGQSYSIRPKNNIARTGYTFSHWTTSAADAGSRYDAAQNSIGELATFTPAANTVFYAQWTAVSYSLTFETNGGSAAIGTQARTIGQTLSMPSAGTKTGYTFDSWSDGVNSYPAGSTFTVAAANAAFAAQWIPNVYTVTYDWQGGVASGAAKAADSYTVGTGAMTLPTAVGSSYARDGYDFAGWSTSAGGSAVSSFEPTADDVLYALWDDGNFTLSYDAKGGTGSGAGSVARTVAVTMPTPVRSNFTFVGWYDQATGGSKLADGGASYTPVASTSFYARWVQNSLYGVDEATLETAATLTVGGDQSGGSLTRNHSASGTAASVVVPDGALPANTVVTARYFKDTERQSGLIPGDNNYIFSLLVSWLTGSGDSATVPNTATGKPITVTLTSSAIKAGQMIYQVVGTTVTELGRATSDGSITVELTEDPEIVIAATKPNAPTSISAAAGDTQATVSWSAPESGGSAITSYTVTSTPGSFTCTTATTSCVVTGLTNGTSYTFTVTASNSVGTSSSSGSSSSIAVAATTYNASFNSNGGSSVSTATFIAGGSISEPTAPTKSGYTFNGWSTTLDDAATKVTFPYSPGVTNSITLYALWTADPVPASGGSNNSSVVSPTPTPTPPATPVTKPIGSVEGSNQEVTVTADAPKEKLVAKGAGWELSIAAKTAPGQSAPVTEQLSLEFQLATKAAVSGSGLRPNTKVTVWVFSDPTYVGEAETLEDGSFAAELALPASILPGEHTMQVLSTDALGRTITLNIPITVKGKVTVGTFKGYLALYTKDLVGQKFSAKVAGKWIVQNPIANYKSYGYSRIVRKTGAGYRIYVHLYLNGAFLRTDLITTK